MNFSSQTATARDGRKKIIAQIMLLIHKKSLKIKSAIFFHFSHHLTNTFLIFHMMWQVKISLAKKNPSARGFARFSDEICIDDISADLSATLHHLGWIIGPHTQNFEIGIYSLEKTQELKKIKSFLMFL
jgi:hypothetical protein